jgi:hypothetical protein
MTQLAFDIDDLIRESAPPPEAFAGRAPLHFTVEVFTVPELQEAWDHFVRVNGHFDSIARSHMWNGREGSDATPGHAMRMFSADLRCGHYSPMNWHGESSYHYCPAYLVRRVVCECTYATPISTSERAVVEDWHDHAWAGWRDLLPIPERLRGGTGNSKMTPALSDWVANNYPAGWGTDGAPIVTERDTAWATRHVPGYSPWGGYDLAAPFLTSDGKIA